MKRLLLVIGLFTIWVWPNSSAIPWSAQPLFASFTNCDANEDGASSGTTVTVDVANVTSGDFAFIGWGGQDTGGFGPTTATDEAGTNFTELTESNYVTAGTRVRLAYGVTTASGTVTFTGSYGGSVGSTRMHVLVCTISGSVTIEDDEAAQQVGGTTAITTGPLTWASSDAMGFAFTYGLSGGALSASPTPMAIGGTAATTWQPMAGEVAHSWWATLSGAGSGAATATKASGAHNTVAMVGSIGGGGGGGGSTAPALLTGVGR